jgi:hydrogenase expression/formation protein HypE
MAKKRLKAGKLDISFLDNLLQAIPLKDKRVIVGPRIGEDAAVIEIKDRYLVVGSDPITFVSEDIGYYAVHINANDIAVLGAVPKWFLATLLFPEKGSSHDTIEKIFQQIVRAAEPLHISLIGGHTEIVTGIDRPIVSGHMIGEAEKDLLVQTSGARPGDKLILTKGVCIEGASIIARERGKDLLKRGFPKKVLQKAKDLIYDPGISVVNEALIVTKKDGVTSMHDPTEGGLAMGCYEIARAADVGMIIFEENVPVLGEAKMLCREYGLDPLGTIASGALLLTVKADKFDDVLSVYEKNGISACLIGEITDKKRGVVLESGGRAKEMPSFERDEIGKIF